ncbi:MAG: Methionine aminopeptidase 1 [bacterium ADurb.Bin374]|nr:MAG: Methionine aminopeptidase 1 [bacterium ADurb.Bin374]
MIPLKTPAELGLMQENGGILATVLEGVKLLVNPGVTTYELDRFAEDAIRKAGAVPAFKGYRGYPSTLCCSVNEQVVHGFPSKKRKLQEGDIISLDIGLKRGGLFSDMAVTLPVGKASDAVIRFLEITEKSLREGIKQARPGNRLGDISNAIQSYVEHRGFSVVRDYVGHGIGHRLHEEPALPNFGPPHVGPRLEVGMVLAIEPMVNMGAYAVRVLDDGWTVVTEDGSLSAHFEHSVAVTSDGPRVLTNLPVR